MSTRKYFVAYFASLALILRKWIRSGLTPYLDLSAFVAEHITGAAPRQAYHTKLTKLLERGDITHGSSSMPSDIEKAALDSAAEALGLSREQVREEGTQTVSALRPLTVSRVVEVLATGGIVSASLLELLMGSGALCCVPGHPRRTNDVGKVGSPPT